MSALIKVRTRNGEAWVEAMEAHGVWALHRSLDDGLAVTHVPSGFAAVAQTSEDSARRAFAVLADRWPTWRCEVQWGAVPAAFPAMRDALIEARGGW